MEDLIKYEYFSEVYANESSNTAKMSLVICGNFCEYEPSDN